MSSLLEKLEALRGTAIKSESTLKMQLANEGYVKLTVPSFNLNPHAAVMRELAIQYGFTVRIRSYSPYLDYRKVFEKGEEAGKAFDEMVKMAVDSHKS